MTSISGSAARLPHAPKAAQSSQEVVDDLAVSRRAEAEQAATDFENMFTDLMLKSMRQTALPEDSSNANEIYQGMLDQEYSKSLAARGDLGIKDMILKWMEEQDPSLAEARAAKSALGEYQSQAAAMSVRTKPAL